MISHHILIRSFSAAAALSLVIIGIPAQLWAGPITGTLPTLLVTIEGSPSANWPSWSYRPTKESFSAPDSTGAYEYTGTLDQDILQGRAHIKLLDLDFNPDPFVLNNVLVTNTTVTPQVYSVFVALPTLFGAPNTISGNVRTSVIDGGFDGATISAVAGQSLYQAQIDFATVATLQNDPFSVVAPAGGSNTASATFGPSVSGIPVATNIGVQLRFTLSAGDTASILSRFDVVPVPEPSTIALTSLLAAAVFGIRGRRSR